MYLYILTCMCVCVCVCVRACVCVCVCVCVRAVVSLVTLQNRHTPAYCISQLGCLSDATAGRVPKVVD